MFDFENLQVYNKAKCFNRLLRKHVLSNQLDTSTSYQLRRAALSVMLNIAEGSGRFSKLDKRRFYIFARGSLFETVAILDFLFEEKQLDHSRYNKFYALVEELSRILFVMIRNLEKK